MKHESEFDDDEGDEDDYEEEDEYDEDDEEEEEEEEEDGAEEEEEEEEVKPRDRSNPGSRGRRPVNGTKANGRDGLFNLGSSLTVTGIALIRAFPFFPYCCYRSKQYPDRRRRSVEKRWAEVFGDDGTARRAPDAT